MSRESELEQELIRTIENWSKSYSDLGKSFAWTLTRTLIHRAVHHAVESESVEFCSLATYFGEMLVHAHQLAHGDNPGAPTHVDRLH